MDPSQDDDPTGAIPFDVDPEAAAAPAEPPPTSLLGIAALALGLVGLFTGGLAGAGSAIGLLLGVMALFRRDRTVPGSGDVAFAAVAANAFALLSLAPLLAVFFLLRSLPMPASEPTTTAEAAPMPAPEPTAAPVESAPPDSEPDAPPAVSQRQDVPPPRVTQPAATVPPTTLVADPTPAPPPEAPAAVRAGGNVREPRKVVNVSPVYPPLARQARVGGIVILEAQIATDGRVEKVTILRGVPMLNDAAEKAVRQWRYEPTLLEGRPVPVVMTVTVNFKLD